MRNLHLIDAHVQEKMEKRRSARLIFSFNAFFCENRFLKKPKSLITRSTCLGDFRNVVLQQWAKLWTRKQKADVVTTICFLLNIFFAKAYSTKFCPKAWIMRILGKIISCHEFLPWKNGNTKIISNTSLVLSHRWKWIQLLHSNI